MSGFNKGSSGFPENKKYSRIMRILLNSHLIRNRYRLKHYRGIPFFSTTRGGHLRLLAFSTLSTIYVNFRLTNDIPTEQGTKTLCRESERNDYRMPHSALSEHSNFVVSINFFLSFSFSSLSFFFLLLKCYAYQPSPSRREDCRRSRIRLEPANCNVWRGRNSTGTTTVL